LAASSGNTTALSKATGNGMAAHCAEEASREAKMTAACGQLIEVRASVPARHAPALGSFKDLFDPIDDWFIHIQQ
jgi:hypothetical protein